MNQKFLKPVNGLVVRDPESKEILPVDGSVVAMNSYWRRRVQDGSVTEVSDVSAPAIKIEKPFKKGIES